MLNSHIRLLIPLKRNVEGERIRNEISGLSDLINCDGTTRLGEALAIVLRYVTTTGELYKA